MWLRVACAILASCATLPGAAAEQAPAPAAAPSPAAPAAAAPAAPTALPARAEQFAPEIPIRPDEPRAAKAYYVLDRYCARCHQSGRTETPLASGHLANILAIGDLARDPVLVRPGLPDASRLYDILATRHAPLDIYGDAATAIEPTADEIMYVREWIRDLPTGAKGCKERAPAAGAEGDRLMREAQLAERDEASDVRFISLVHLYNACATPAEMKGYAEALNKLINGLSWSAEPIKLTPLDATGTLFSFKLSDIGWRKEQWTEIASQYPQTLVRKIDPEIVRIAGTAMPVFNGDWFAATVTAPPLYYGLLGLPANLTELARMNGVDIDSNIRKSAVRRILVTKSEVTRANRMIERHPGTRGGFWLVYDFATSNGAQDLITYPLGPKSATGARAAFKPDEIRVIFALPNGFLAYALFNAAGNRIDRVLPGIERPYAGIEAGSPEPNTEAAQSCYACHTSGIIGARDEFRPFVDTQTGATPSEARSAAVPLFGSDSENALLIAGDVDRYLAALAKGGINPRLQVRGEEPVSALVRRYEEDSDLDAAVEETGAERGKFVAELASSGGAAAPLARRLIHGVLPRADLDRLFALLKGIDAPNTSTAKVGFLSTPKSEIGLSLWIDKARPVAGDSIVVHAETDSTCYLTIIGVDEAGMATVLFPNDFQTDNRIAPGEQLSVPPPESRFKLRYKGDGLETLIARCSASAAPPAGIEHDFIRQRFTVLGNWESFIMDTLVTEAELRRDPGKAARAQLAQAGARRQRQARGEAVDQRPDIAQSKKLRDGRAILVLGTPRN